MAVQLRQGSMPHIYWIDLKNDGVYVECAVMKQDQLGNVHFFQLNALDSIDKRRLARILTNRNAAHFELWDLMSNITLNNGVNALEYFHQLVDVITPSGKTMRPREGVIGVGDSGTIDTRGKDARKSMEEAASIAANAAATAAATAAAAAVQGMNPQQAPPVNVTESSPPPPKKKRTTRKPTENQSAAE